MVYKSHQTLPVIREILCLEDSLAVLETPDSLQSPVLQNRGGRGGDARGE